MWADGEKENRTTDSLENNFGRRRKDMNVAGERGWARVT